VLQLHEEKLTVHRDPLELIAVGQDEIGVKLEAAFAEPSEDADDLVGTEEIAAGHAGLQRRTAS
jgi:hypothetical protein